MKSLTEGGHPAELVAMGTGEDRCHICDSVRTGSRKPPSCTSLLYHPRLVLSDKQRWPDHLCYSDFMQRSVETWVSKVVGGTTPAIKLWAECYPLPVGEEAARRLYAGQGQSYPDALSGLLPFEGTEQAYWALQVTKEQAIPGFYGEKNKAVLDMFGLKGPASPEDQARDYLWLGAFAYSLRSLDDTSLVELVRSGARWWNDFSNKVIRGRPLGTGTWISLEEFEEALRRVVRALVAGGHKPTQERVARQLQTDDRTLRRWVDRYYGAGTGWDEVLKKV